MALFLQERDFSTSDAKLFFFTFFCNSLHCLDILGLNNLATLFGNQTGIF